MASFADLPPGRYQMRIEAYGFARLVRDEDVTAQQERPVLVTLKPAVLGCAPHYWIDYDDRPGSHVRGMVLDGESGKGIRGVKIQLRLPGEKKPIVNLRSRGKSMFEMPQIAPGRYRLRIMDGTEYPDSTYQTEEIDLVVPTQDSLSITFKLMRKGFIEICR